MANKIGFWRKAKEESDLIVVKEKKVLIVDDESFNRMAMRSMLDIVGL